MTRKSKRDIEREVDSLKDTPEESDCILFVQETDAGEVVTLDGEPVPEEELAQAGLVFHFTQPE